MVIRLLQWNWSTYQLLLRVVIDSDVNSFELHLDISKLNLVLNIKPMLTCIQLVSSLCKKKIRLLVLFLQHANMIESSH